MRGYGRHDVAVGADPALVSLGRNKDTRTHTRTHTSNRRVGARRLLTRATGVVEAPLPHARHTATLPYHRRIVVSLSYLSHTLSVVSLSHTQFCRPSQTYTVVSLSLARSNTFWASDHEENDDGELEIAIDLFRLRPCWKYEYKVYARLAQNDAVSVASGKFTSPSTNIPRFDSGPLLSFEHASERPSFHMVTFQYSGGFCAGAYESDDDDADVCQTFDGLVACDPEGWVVWAHHDIQPYSWDFLPGGNIVMLLDLFMTTRMRWWEDDADDTTTRWNENSRLVEYTPRGMQVNHYEQACSGGPENFNMFNHDMYVDTITENDDGTTAASVLTFAWDLRETEKTTVTLGEGSKRGVTNWLGSQLVRWDRLDNSITTELDMWELASPEMDGYLFEVGHDSVTP